MKQTTTPKGKSKMRTVMVTTEYKGVFIGDTKEELKELNAENIELENCLMVIYWGTTKGLFQLAKSGPTKDSKLSDRVKSIKLKKVTAVIELTKEAMASWKKA